MKTNTQRNFKKEMDQIEREMKSKPTEGFYSYVEGDYINSYYTRKKKKREKIVKYSFISILILAVNVYALYTWLDPIIYHTTGHRIPRIERHIFNNSPKTHTQTNGANHVQAGYQPNLKHIKADQYIQKIKVLMLDTNQMINYATDNFNKAADNQNFKQEYSINLNKYKEEIQSFILELRAIIPPSEFSEYHKLNIDFYNTAHEVILIYLGNIRSNTRNFEMLSVLYERNNLRILEIRQEILKGLDALSIEYEVIENSDSGWSINYRINN